MVAVLQPLKSGKIIAIDRAVVLVGRGSDCDAIITDSQKISRRHCCLVQVDNSYFIRDLGSMNGIWVNGSRVSRENLMTAGDRVQIGDVEFKFHPNARIEQKKAVATPPPPDKNQADEAQPIADNKLESDLISSVAEIVAQPVNQDEEIDLISTGQIKLIKIQDAVEEDDVAQIEEYEILDDVIPLEDNSLLLMETNEVETSDEPIIDEEKPGNDDDEIVVFED